MSFYKFSFLSFLVLLLTFNHTTTFGQSNTNALLGKWQKARSAKTYRSDTGSVALLNRLSEQYLYNNADSALYFANQALQLAQAQKYTRGQAAAWNNASSAWYVLGDYTSSLDDAAKLAAISAKINYQPGIAASFQLNGLIYLAQDKNEEAASDFNKALKIFNKLHDTARIGKIYFDLGICYDESKQPEKAFYYLDKASEVANKIADGQLLSMVLNRTGETYFHTKNYKKALDYYQQVIDLKSASNWERDFAYSGKAQTYYQLGAYNNAIADAQKSLLLAKQVNSAFDAVRALQILSDSYAAIKDYKNAYNYHARLKKSNDSLFNSEKENEINYLRLKQQQADNIRLKGEIKAKEQTIAFGYRLFVFRNLAAACVIVIFIVIVRNSRRTKALNKILQKQNDDIAAQKEEISAQKEALDDLNNTKDRLFSVISHDLRSPFSAMLQTMDAIRAGDMSVEEQHEVLEDFYQQVSLVTVMVNNLLIWANSQQSGIKINLTIMNLTEAVDEIVSVSNFLARNKKIRLLHNFNSEKCVLADRDHVKIIIQNLIGNAIKFTPADGTIEIFYTEDENHHIVHVKDTGIGIPAKKMAKLFKISGREISGYGTNNEAGAGIGLILIKQFVEANGGKINIESKPGKGTEFAVYFKKA